MEKMSTGHIKQQLTEITKMYANGVMAIYSGTQPASADDAETGSLLCLITRNSGAFTPGDSENGLNFKLPLIFTGEITKDPEEIWSGIAINDGVAGWFRFYDNTYTTGESFIAKRFDGSISNVGSPQLIMMNNTNVFTGMNIEIDNFIVKY